MIPAEHREIMTLVLRFAKRDDDDGINTAMNARIDAALEWLSTLPDAPQPNWEDAPEWAEWWAVDADGTCVWFEDEPDPRGIAMEILGRC